MAASSHKTYEIQTKDNSKILIKIAEAACQAENLILATWSSSFLLSNVLHKLEINIPPQSSRQDEYSILELGAGTGLTGLSAAAIWRASSLLTDLPSIVPGLLENVHLNKETLRTIGANVSCGSLDWNVPDTYQVYDANGASHSKNVVEMEGFPLVIAADTMYTEEHPELLSQTIAKCLRRESYARFIMCCPLRIAYLDHFREFWERMDELGLVVEQEGRQEIDLTNWDDERLHEWSVWKWKDL